MHCCHCYWPVLICQDLSFQGMFNLANDISGGVRRQVCAGLVLMLQLCPEKLEPSMKDIIEYMLHSTSVRTYA